MAKTLTIAAFLLPTVLGFVLFSFTPILRSFYLSFTSWDILQPAEWIGLGNYRQLLQSEEFRRARVDRRGTLVYYVISEERRGAT